MATRNSCATRHSWLVTWASQLTLADARCLAGPLTEQQALTLPERRRRSFIPSGRWNPPPARGAMVPDGERGVYMGQTARFQETLRRLAMIDECFVENQARLGLDLPAAWALDPKTAALLRVAACVAAGAPPVCLEWSTGRALAAGASEDEIADVLLAIAPVTGLGRIVTAAPEVAIALGYDTEAALEEPDD